jgi:CubicO group peptidase (beta-lactamase class C family)
MRDPLSAEFPDHGLLNPLAGQIVEDVSGLRYEDFLQTRILDPLGMNDTTYSEATRRPEQPPIARSYRVQGGVNRPAFRIGHRQLRSRGQHRHDRCRHGALSALSAGGRGARR